MGSQFYFGGSDESGSDFDGNGSSLPFPKPLSRSAFLEPDFNPSTFLANLCDRYQTLEDLRDELQDLSQSLNKELLDLVNDNYQDFLSLGSTLHGGEEKVEEVRVGLLSLQRELSSVRENVDQRRQNAAGLVDEKRKLMSCIQAGRWLLEIAAQIEDLELSMMIETNTDGKPGAMKVETQEIAEESDEEAENSGFSMTRLKGHVQQYLVLRLLLRRHSPRQPYIQSQSNRIARIKSTLSLDLEAAVKHYTLVQKNGGDSSRVIDHLTELLHLINEPDQLTILA